VAVLNRSPVVPPAAVMAAAMVLALIVPGSVMALA
jgi:hypothetical protein